MGDYQTADAGPSSGGITVDTARPTLQARVTALEFAFKNVLEEQERSGKSRDFMSNLIKELRKEVGLDLPPETPPNSISDDVLQERFAKYAEDPKDMERIS